MKPASRVEVKRRLGASMERVFSMFAKADAVAQWLSPSPEVKLTVLAFDFREGGSYRFAYDVPDGRRMLVGGVYRTIARPERLVFSWLIDPPDEHAGIESQVTVTLTYYLPTGEGLELPTHGSAVVSFSGHRLLYFGRTAETHVEYFPQ